MGIIKQGISGAVSGKVGSVVGAVWKGIATLRGLPTSMANPQTEAQLAQRQKFAVTMGFLQPISQFLQFGFKNYAIGMTGINAAFSYNFANALTGAYPNTAVDYPNALVTRGNLPRPLNQATASLVAGTVVFTWDDNSGEVGASALDKTLLVVHNPVKKQAVTIDQLAERADGTQTVNVPAAFSGDLVQCYIAFINETGSLSNSGYAGAVTVA